MSAFVVSDKHISAMIQTVTMSGRASYYWNGERHDMRGQRQEIGQKLLDENYRSVNARYSDSDEPHQFVMQRVDRVSMVQLIKACHCYNYQACETNDWNETEAHAIVKGIEAYAVRRLPGYEQSDWEIC